MVNPFAIAALTSALLLAGSARADPSALSPPQSHFRLTNGLDVLIEENHREPHVAVTVSYDVGARDDPAGYASLAHLVEHLTYRRSRHLHDYGIHEWLERAGAESMNGETRRDDTLFYAVVPSKALALALWLESERMGFTLETFDHAAVAHERDVLRAELLAKRSETSQFRGQIANVLYGEDHPYARLERREDDLDALRLREVQWFFQRGYRPDNAHLVIVGDVTLADGRALVERYFGTLVAPASKLVRSPPIAPARPTGRHLTYYTLARTSRVAAVFRAPRPGTRAHRAAAVLARALRVLLVPSLVEQERVAAFVDVELESDASESLLWLTTAPRQGVSYATLEGALQRALAHVEPDLLADALVEARAELLEHEWRLLEDPLARARAHVDALASYGRPDDTAARVRALRELTPKDLADVLATLSTPLLVAEMVYSPRASIGGDIELSNP